MTTNDLFESQRLEHLRLLLELATTDVQQAKLNLEHGSEWRKHELEKQSLEIELAKRQLENEKIRTEMFQKIVSGEIKLTA